MKVLRNSCKGAYVVTVFISILLVCSGWPSETKAEAQDAELHLNRARSYLGKGMWGDGMMEIRRALRIDPNYPEAHYLLGVVYSNLGHWQEVASAAEEAVRLKSDYAEAQYLLGVAYFRLGNRSSALEQHRVLEDLDLILANKLLNLIAN